MTNGNLNLHDILSKREVVIFDVLKRAARRGNSASIDEMIAAVSADGTPITRQAINMNLKYLAAKLSMNSAPWRIVRESKPRGRGNTGIFRLEEN